VTTGFRARRTILFVPAVRPDRYPKALATGADAVCIDLEDGVGFAAKDEARDNAMALFSERAPTRADVVLRINDPKGDLGRRDLAALVDAGVRPDALMLPKVSGGEEIGAVQEMLGDLGRGLPLVIQIETAAGVARAREIATASEQVSALFFGAIDFAADVGCAVEWDALLHARAEVVLASALSGVRAIDTPFMDVLDLEALAIESRRARALGFVGKAAIHPSQVTVIQEAFTPSAEELAWARRIVRAYEKNQGGVLLVDGQLIERPVIAAAHSMLQMASSDMDTGS